VERFAAAVIKKFKNRRTSSRNYAGVTLFGRADDVSYREFEWIMASTVGWCMERARSFRNFRTARGLGGHLRALSGCSVFPRRPLLRTKFRGARFTESLQRELKDTPITAISVHPGG
jgi:NAD(P)-dependent dehydrogenase (short-subunit alcohol dehydrogenase family)